MLMIKTATTVIGAAALALALDPSPACAHVTVQPAEADAGKYSQIAFTVPHGCAGSATVALRVKMPDGVSSVKPQMKPGWTVEIRKKKPDAPVQSSHGHAITEVVDEVSWRGGPLPDDLFDTFGLVMKLPDTPGQPLYFPAVQECEQGVSRWIEIPAAGQAPSALHEPAPAVQLRSGRP